MDFDATIDLIIKELREASDIIDDLKSYPGIPQLQVELAKLKCKSAGEVIGMLKTLKSVSSFAGSEAVPHIKVQKQSPPVDDKPLAVKEIITQVVEQKRVSTSLTEIKSPPVEKIPESKKPEVMEQGTPMVADKFTQVSNSFNEELGTSNGEDDIAEIMKTKPITSLVEAIGLNDKFLFIGKIFKGNKTEYNQAISRLESVENITDARAIIMSYTGGNDESDAVQQLLDLVKRKLPANE